MILKFLIFIAVLLLLQSSSTLKAQSYLTTSADLAIGFYQQILSPIRQPASQCQFTPSCSQYAKEAIGLYGPLIGIPLAADRLMRCGVHSAKGEYPSAGKLLSDPPSKNYLFGTADLWKLGLYKASVPDTVTAAASFEFPYRLFLEGEYDYSVIELKRVQQSAASSQEQNYTHTLIAINHLCNKSFSKAHTEIDKIELTTLSPIHRCNTFLIDYLIGDAENLDDWNAARCRQWVKDSAGCLSGIFNKLEVYSLVKADEYDSARAHLPLNLANLKYHITAVENSGSKSAAFAGILSAIIPGSGYVYAGKWTQGISALTVNALLGWGIYSLFKNHNTGSGILLSSIAAPFYLGNIVGAANAAKAENGKSKEVALAALRNRFELDFYFSMDFLKQCWK